MTAKKMLAMGSGLLMITVMTGCGSTVDLNKYAEIEITGHNGYGTAKLTWDMEALEADCGKLKFSNGSSVGLLYDEPIDYLRDFCIDI